MSPSAVDRRRGQNDARRAHPRGLLVQTTLALQTCLNGASHAGSNLDQNVLAACPVGTCPRRIAAETSGSACSMNLSQSRLSGRLGSNFPAVRVLSGSNWRAFFCFEGFQNTMSKRVVLFVDYQNIYRRARELFHDHNVRLSRVRYPALNRLPSMSRGTGGLPRADPTGSDSRMRLESATVEVVPRADPTHLIDRNRYMTIRDDTDYTQPRHQ